MDSLAVATSEADFSMRAAAASIDPDSSSMVEPRPDIFLRRLYHKEIRKRHMQKDIGYNFKPTDRNRFGNGISRSLK